MTEPTVERGSDRPNVRLECRCGWAGPDEDVEAWAVDPDRDRVVRRCPACDDPVPEWGALGPIDGAAKIARGSLADALVDAGYLDGESDPG